MTALTFSRYKCLLFPPDVQISSRATRKLTRFFCICDDLEVKGKQLFTGPTQPGCRAVRADLGSQLAKEFCWTQIISSNKVTHGL